MKQESSQLLQIIKLMNMMVRDMKRDGRSNPLDGRFVARLMKRGFRLDDIETALRWLATMAAEEEIINTTLQDPEVRNPAAVRQLHAAESVRLTVPAQRMLLQLLAEGRIAPLHLERTLEYLWRNDLRLVGPQRLELLLYMQDPQAFAESVPESRSGQDRLPPPIRVH